MDYGYGFMRGAPANRDEVKRPVQAMEMDELRGYLCAKTLGNPKTCISCDGFKGCPVGQRALALLSREAMEKAQYRKVWDEEKAREDEKAKKENAQTEQAAPAKINTQADTADFLAACESGNARRWLLQKGYSEAAAQEKLVYWIKHYPAITRQYGRQRILAKPRMVVVTSLTVEPDNATTEAKQQDAISPANFVQNGRPAAQDGQTLIQEPKAPERPKNGQENASEEKHSRFSEEAKKHMRELRVAAGRKACAEALASGDPVAYQISQGKTRNAALQAMIRWRERYPDLFETAKEPVQQDIAPQETSADSEDSGGDEISLMDFLRQYGAAEEPQEEPVPEPAKTEVWEGTGMELALLMARESKLMQEITEVQDRIRQALQQRHKITEEMGK